MRNPTHAIEERDFAASVSVLSCESTSAVALVIDDDDETRRSLRLLLESCGFTVITADNGVRGLQAFRNILPALVLVAAAMPRLNGWEAAKQMRREWSASKIVMMMNEARETGNNSPNTPTILNADACVQKPFDAKQLLGILWHVLGKTGQTVRGFAGASSEAQRRFSSGAAGAPGFPTPVDRALAPMLASLSEQPRETPRDNGEKEQEANRNHAAP